MCFSRSAIEAGTESASHGLAQASEKPSIFFKTNVTDALNKTKEEVSSEFQEISTSFPERQEAAKQALAFGDEETRSRTHQRSEGPLTWRAFLPFRLSPIAGGLHVQERAETS